MFMFSHLPLQAPRSNPPEATSTFFPSPLSRCIMTKISVFLFNRLPSYFGSKSSCEGRLVRIKTPLFGEYFSENHLLQKNGWIFTILDGMSNSTNKVRPLYSVIN